MNRRFFVDHIPLAGNTVDLDPQESRHAQIVLRAREGEQLQLLDGKGTLAEASIVHLGKRREPVRCHIESSQTLAPNPLAIRLYVAPPRGKGMNRILQQSVELGVDRIYPILCQRSSSRPDAGSLVSWETVAREACKQSGNVFLPKIAAPREISEAASAPFAGAGYFGSIPTAADTVPSTAGDPSVVGGSCKTPAGRVSAADAHQRPSPAKHRPLRVCTFAHDDHCCTPDARYPPRPEFCKSPVVELWVGPEGGFTNTELEMLRDRGLLPLAIGRWTLRVGTAVVAGLTWIQQRYCS